MQTTIHTRDVDEAAALLGDQDEHLRALRQVFNARISARGTEITIAGERHEVEAAARVIQGFIDVIRRGHTVAAADVRYAAQQVKSGRELDIAELYSGVILRTHRGRFVKPRTVGQRRYVQAIRRSDLTFAIGPAGTGKTYLAVAMAIATLQAREVERIILTRPAVEAGESLGFLPGDLREKVDPYLRPLYDALYDMIGVERARKLMERQTIEVVPLAYMRGRTLNDAFIILDEAQNCTVRQMQMFLTRMGTSSKVVVTGDVTQVDLPVGQVSGLIHAEQILRDEPDMEFVYLTEDDVVRHPLVRRIIRAYERDAARRNGVGHG